MRLLVLGGGDFAGWALVREALDRGADVTVLNRGSTPAPPGVRALVGDRTAPDGLVALGQDTWDVVADTWSAAPWVVRDSARLLADRAGCYAYVSSRSVYTYPPARGLDESGPLVEAGPDDGADGQELEYARAKRGAELAVTEAFGDRGLLARAGLILGPRENIGRLPWWLRRIAAGGDVAAPGPPDLGLQYIDVRDLAAWMLDAAGAGRGGAFNTVSPPGFTTTGELLGTCIQVTGSDATLRWIAPEVIEQEGVAPWTELPLWLPPGPEHDGLHGGNVDKARAAGLTCRPVTQTVQDTWDWLRALPGDPPRHAERAAVGLSAEAEQRLLRRQES